MSRERSEVAARARRRLGRHLAATRRDRGMTVAQVARELEVGASTVTNWERGRSAPKPEYLYMLRDLLDCTFEELMG